MSGVKALSLIVTDLADGQGSIAYQWPLVNNGTHLKGYSGSGYVTNTQPVTENPRVITSVRAKSPNDLFYNRIIITPTDLALGNLLSSQVREVKIWNGYLVEKPLTLFQSSDAEGIDVNQPVAVPYNIRPLQELTYSLNITLEGPVNIDAQFAWTIDGQVYIVTVTGSRIVVLPFPPNWRSAKPTESLAWLTDVATAFSGKEQRRSLRTKARRSFSFTISVQKQDAAYFDNLMWGWQNRIFALPVWTDRARLSTPHVAGDSIINLATSTFSFAAGGLAILYRGVRDFEVVEIDAITPTALRLARPIQGSYDYDQLILPVVTGHLPKEVAIDRLTSGVSVAAIVFDTEPSTNDPYTPDGPIPTPYLGLDVIDKKPNWGPGVSVTAGYEFDVIDAQTGKIAWSATQRSASNISAYGFVMRDRNELLAFRQLLGRLLGRAKTCWVPTWTDDFKVLADIGSADISLIVEDNGFRTLVGLDPYRNHVMIRLNDGRVFYRQIVGVGSSGQNAVIQLSAALGVAVPRQAFNTIHLLSRCRLASDTLELVWETDRVVTVSSAFKTVMQ